VLPFPKIELEAFSLKGRRSGWRNGPWRHFRGTPLRPIWCATMMLLRAGLQTPSSGDGYPWPTNITSLAIAGSIRWTPDPNASARLGSCSHFRRTASDSESWPRIPATTMRRARIYRWTRIPRWSNGPALSTLCRFCRGCIIATRGN